MLLATFLFAAFTTVIAQPGYVQPMRYDDYSLTTKINIGAGTVRVTAPSAYLEVGPTSGATKGMLAPRLTSTERDAIASPADGLWIYNKTTHKFQYYDGGSSIWRDIGSGAGGSGITQLGSSPWGLSILNDSTYLVDSMKVLTKYQGEKMRDSLAALINLKLAKSDSLTGGNPTGFVTKTILKDSIANRVKTSQVMAMDTTGAITGQIPYLDRTGGDTIKFKNDSVGSVGGSGAFSVLKWRTGDENAPEAGDSLIVHTSFSGKYGEMYRGSNYGYFLESVVGDTGFTRVNDTTFKVKPAFAANEWYYIRLTDSSSLTQLTLENHGAPTTTIAYVSSTDGGNNGGSGNTRTFSHTTGSGTDRYLLVGVIGDVTSGANDPVSVTYNGVSMTLLDSMKAVNGGNRYNYVWGLANPASGAHNVVVTFTGSHYILTGAIEYSGVQGVDVTTKSDALTNSKTTSITTTANNSWPVIFSTTPGLLQTAGSGATERAEAASQYWAWYDSNGPVTPAGAYSMNTTSFSGSGICHIIIALKPY